MLTFGQAVVMAFGLACVIAAIVYGVTAPDRLTPLCPTCRRDFIYDGGAECFGCRRAKE